MITTVLVKYGRPVLCLPYRALQLIALLAIVINVVCLVYIVELFVIAVHLKYHIESYLSLAPESKLTLPLLTIVPGILTLPLCIFNIYCLYRAFQSTRADFRFLLFLGWLLIGALIFVLFIFMILTLVNGQTADKYLLNGLLNSMNNYGIDGLTKQRIDKMQVELQCCGSKNYTDWYDIDWYDKNFVRSTLIPVVGEAPFSCCSIRSVYPCIHHGIESGAGPYKYTPDANFSLSVNGCYRVLEDRKMRSSMHIAGYIFCLIMLQFSAAVPHRLVQTAHIERGKIDKESHIYTSWIIGCYIGKKKSHGEPPPVPEFIE